MEKQRTDIKALTALKNFLQKENPRRGTITINNFGHDISYSGLISVTNEDKTITIKKERNADTGITFPVSSHMGEIETMYVNKLEDDNHKLVYARKK